MDHLGGFDPSTMQYYSTQMAHPNSGGASDPFQDLMVPTMDMQEQQSAYGYAPSDDFSIHGLQAQAPPQLRRWPSTYEDPFSDVVSAFDPNVTVEPADPEAPSIDRDNKLLGFSLPRFDFALADYTFRRTTMSLTAQLHGMFFLAESPWTSNGDVQPPPNELTCYRRNLFQITGEVTMPRGMKYILTEQGEHLPIITQELTISATESTEGNPVKIISVPWKTPTNPTAPSVEDKIEREPPSIALDVMNAQDMDSDFATCPFQWKRLQFRIATANNGRRKELQQHFVVRLRVVGTLATGAKVSICEIQSNAIIVRGRSPRNFQSRKDLPLNGGGHMRKTSNINRASSNDSAGGGAARLPEGGPTSAPIKAEGQDAQPVQSYFENANGNTQLDFFDWKGTPPARQGAMTSVPPEAGYNTDGNVYAESSPELTRAPQTMKPPPAPINLSLVEDESPHPRKSETPPEQRVAKKMTLPPRPPSFSLNTINSPDESADLLYEYFPLGLDDWMPPVDAVYRPHVVHHTKLPSDPRDPKTTAKKARSKRYFVEDDT